MSINPDDNNYCGNCGAILSIKVKNALHNEIKNAIKEQLKDQKVVEIEIAQAIASRLSAWVKLFAFFVGVPLAIFAIVLGFIGFKEYTDLSKKVAIVKDELGRAENDVLARLKKASKEADKVDKDVKDLSVVNERLRNISSQVKQLQKVTFPKIQIKLNDLNCDYKATIKLALQVARSVDILEMGNSCVKAYDLSLVKEIRARFPRNEIAVDINTMYPSIGAELFYAAGVDILIIPGTTDLNAIKGVISMANKYGKQVQIDLTNVPNKAEVAKAAAALGIHIIGVQTGIDQQIAGQSPWADLDALLSLNLVVETSVAGDIKPSTVAQFVKAGTNIIVVGDAISKAVDPAADAAKLRKLVDAAKSP